MKWHSKRYAMLLIDTRRLSSGSEERIVTNSNSNS